MKYKKEWNSMEQVAHMFKFWSAGENRPVDGSFVGLQAHGKAGKYSLPKFYN